MAAEVEVGGARLGLQPERAAWWPARHTLLVAGAYALAGHRHPCVVLGGRAHQRLRLPCFHFGAALGTLPAFGAFTGMHAVRAAPGDRVSSSPPTR